MHEQKYKTRYCSNQFKLHYKLNIIFISFNFNTPLVTALKLVLEMIHQNAMYSNKIINNVQKITTLKNHNHYFESTLYSYTFRFDLVIEGTSQLAKQMAYLEREGVEVDRNRPRILSQ